MPNEDEDIAFENESAYLNNVKNGKDATSQALEEN